MNNNIEYNNIRIIEKNRNELNKNYKQTLNKMIDIYVKHKLQPNNSIYSDSFLLYKKQLKDFHKDYLNLRKDLDGKFNNFVKKTNKLNINLEKTDKELNSLITNVNKLKDGDVTSIGLLDDKRYSYNNEYIENIILTLTIMSGGYFLYKK